MVARSGTEAGRASGGANGEDELAFRKGAERGRSGDPSRYSTFLTFEDFEPGAVFELGSRTLTKEEMGVFAREFDPQLFHVDEEAAASSVFGGLVPSGWHTVAIFMRLYVDVRLFRAAGMGSPGVEEIGWLKPVRPGDTLFARVTVLGATPSDRSSGRGTLHLRSDMRNQHDETVTTLRDGDFSAGTEVASPGKTFVKLNVLSILRQCDGG